jgi:predicted HicB family RNase H-like nuclease
MPGFEKKIYRLEVRIGGKLLREARRAASESGQSLSHWVRQQLRRRLKQSQKPAEKKIRSDRAY